MKLNKSKMKVFMSCMFAFLLTLLFVTLYVCFGFGLGVFNNRSIISNINESKYYSNVCDELNKKAEKSISKAGLPSTVLKDVITLERVYVGGDNYIQNSLKGKEPQIKTEKLMEALSANIDHYLQQEEINQTSELKAGIEELISAIELEYKSGIQLQFVNYITEYKIKYINLMKVIVPMLIVLIGILCFFLIRMHQYKHRGIRYITYALISSSWIIIIAAAYLLMVKSYTKVMLTPDYYHDFLAAYFKWDIIVFIYMGGIGLTIAMALISLIGFLKRRANND
ncbi:MAG: hypothetical protein ACYDEX_18015 [Mobilitalea sp.]